MTLTFVLTVVGFIFGFMVVVALMITKLYRKVEQGKALIISKTRKIEVTFTGGVVLPFIHRAEYMDLSVKTIEINRKGKDGLICMDNIRGDIQVTFFVRVNHESQDVLKVAQSIGCARASQQDTLELLFSAKFAEALKTVGKAMDFEQLYDRREDFRDRIIEVIGQDLNGYKLEDVAIDYLEQTPMTELDPQNILDAQGIRKITELTATQHVRTNEAQRTEEKLVTKQNVEAREAILELERQQADAEAKQKREIATVRAREEAEVLKVQAEEKLKAESARIKATEEIEIAMENKARQVAIAQKNRERVIAVETERVEKDRAMEAISREREVDLSRISKDKAIEKEKKEIADVIRERIAVDKTVAEEEEAIKRLRLVEDAKRNKEATVIVAEGEAQQNLVREIKAADAAEQVAKFRAKEQLTLAEANLEASDKQAKAKIRLAEGVQAESAAEGLAQVRVKEANAIAIEKEGLAQARVAMEKKKADASGDEAIGQAAARVKEADAAASEKQGLALANVKRETGLAEAAATEKTGLAAATVRREAGLAEADATEKQGLAEAVSVKEKLVAEAAGLQQKAQAMKALDGVGRDHEEFRLRLSKEKDVELEQIRVHQAVAEAQARILGEAFKSAKIDIVGGDQQFFERLIGAISYGKAVDGFFDRSTRAQQLLEPYFNGDASLPEHIKEILSRPAVGSKDLQNLSVAQLLRKLASESDGETQGKLAKLVEAATKLGLDKAPTK